MSARRFITAGMNRRLSIRLRSEAIRGRKPICCSTSFSRSMPGAISISSSAPSTVRNTTRSVMKTEVRPSLAANGALEAAATTIRA